MTTWQVSDDGKGTGTPTSRLGFFARAWLGRSNDPMRTYAARECGFRFAHPMPSSSCVRACMMDASWPRWYEHAVDESKRSAPIPCRAFFSSSPFPSCQNFRPLVYPKRRLSLSRVRCVPPTFRSMRWHGMVDSLHHGCYMPPSRPSGFCRP